MTVLNPMVTAPEPPPVKRYVLVFSNLAIQKDLPSGIMEEIGGKILNLSYHWTQTEARKNNLKSKPLSHSFVNILIII